MDGIISLHKSVLGSGERVKEESKASDQSNGDEQSCVQEIVFQQVAAKNDGISPPSHKNLSCSKQLDDQTKVEIDEVMEENQRLKMYLDQLLKDYRTLEMQFRDVMRTNESPRTSYDHKEICAHEQIDLSLGIGGSARKITKIDDNDEARDRKQGLSLGLDCKFDLPENSPNPSFENSVVEEAGETRGLKCVKNVRDDEILQQNPSKRARVSVRVRCDTPTMDDGCQWRKYGQKIAKGNPCPRAYYRCTVAPSCPVRKQVQRCMNDTSILITTYEGTHSHPLPNSATAMASTTSSAASMLIAGSSTSEIGPIPSSTNLSENSKSKPALYLPNPSISSSPLFPTITLDFTSSSSHLNQLGAFAPRYPTTNLNFSCPLPVSYSKGGMLSYAPQPPDKTQTAASLSFRSQPYAPQYNSYLQKTIPNPNPNQQSLRPDTIAAATKAITSSPNFQSVLAAALTSIIDGSGGGAIVSSFPSSSNANKCASSFLNKSSSSTPDLTILSPPFPFPFSNSNKSKSNSTDDNSDRVV